MIRRIIKKFRFTDRDREDVYLSDTDKIRINTEDINNNILQLKTQGTTGYSLNTDIYAMTRLTTPMALKKWLAIEVVGSKPEYTEWLFRLDNGVNEYYHDGANWAIAGATDWNTEQEFNENIEDFVFQDNTKGTRLIINLSTTDSSVTPKIQEIKLLGRFDIDFKDDLLFKTVVRSFKDNLRPVSEAVFKVTPATDTIDLATDYILEGEGYNIVSIESVYDLTDDELEINNLYSSYVPGPQDRDGTYAPGVITLSQAVPEDNFIKIRFIHQPDIVVNTNQDFYDIKSIPAVVFENIEYFKLADGFMNNLDSVKDKVNGTAVFIQPPAVYNVRFEYAVFTLLQLDLQNLMQEIAAYFDGSAKFTSYGLDEEYFCSVSKMMEFSQSQNLDDVNMGTGYFEIKSVVFYFREAEDVPLVTDLNLNITTG